MRAAELAAAVGPGGVLILSGLLAEDVPALQAAYAGGAEVIAARREGAWAALVVRRRR